MGSLLQMNVETLKEHPPLCVVYMTVAKRHCPCMGALSQDYTVCICCQKKPDTIKEFMR